MNADMLELTGDHVTLRPMTPADSAALVAAAADGELWTLSHTVVPDARTVDAYVDVAMQGLAQGTVLPFVIAATRDDGAHSAAIGRVIGSTRLWRIDRANRSLEIGHTWLARSAQRSAANTEAKWLLLRHAFDRMGCIRVQFTTDVLNLASRAAILRLGAVEEGTIRNERIMPDGRRRNSVRYSIIDSEWPLVQAALQARLQRKA